MIDFAVNSQQLDNVANLINQVNNRLVFYPAIIRNNIGKLQGQQASGIKVITAILSRESIALQNQINEIRMLRNFLQNVSNSATQADNMAFSIMTGATPRQPRPTIPRWIIRPPILGGIFPWPWPNVIAPWLKWWLTWLNNKNNNVGNGNPGNGNTGLPNWCEEPPVDEEGTVAPPKPAPTPPPGNSGTAGLPPGFVGIENPGRFALNQREHGDSNFNAMGCGATSWAMAMWILRGGENPPDPTTGEFWGPGGAQWSGLGFTEGDEKKLLNIAAENIRNGIPTVIGTHRNAPPFGHFVTIVGIRDGANPPFEQTDFIVLEPDPQGGPTVKTLEEGLRHLVEPPPKITQIAIPR
ncbi:MAG: hypothetical protein FWG64_10735 [Firmicutes bacterium]|nr:hypothetical protein [Bacillota bacterium]